MPKTLTPRFIDSVKPESKPKEYHDSRQPGLILRVQPSGYKSFIAGYGRGKRVTLGRAGVMTLARARNAAREVLTAAEQGQPIPNPRTRGKMTLGEFLEREYRQWAESHQRAGASNVVRLKRFFADLLDRPLVDLTTPSLERWRSGRLNRGLEASTVNRETAILRAALAKAVEWGHLREHPLATLKLLKTDTGGRVRYLLPEEEKRLRDALAARDAEKREARARGNAWRQERGQKTLPELSGSEYCDHLTPLVLLVMNTGLRRGEALALRWENIRDGTLTVEWKTAKGQKTRHIPLNREARAVLERWREQTGGEGYVFGNGEGRIQDVKKAWAALVGRAQLKDFRFHDLRHHFASRLVQSGVNLYVVQKLLGHSTIRMTERYSHLAPRDTREAVERILQ